MKFPCCCCCIRRLLLSWHQRVVKKKRGMRCKCYSSCCSSFNSESGRNQLLLLVLFSSPWSMVSWSPLPDLTASSSSSHELLESLKHLPVKNLTSTSLLRQFSFWSIPLLSCLVSSFPSLKDELVCEILLAFCGGWSSFFLRPSLPYTENSLFLHIRLLISFMIMRGEKMRMERECQSDKDHHLLPSVSVTISDAVLFAVSPSLTNPRFFCMKLLYIKLSSLLTCNSPSFSGVLYFCVNNFQDLSSFLCSIL